MVGISTAFVDQVSQLTVPTLESWVRYQYPDSWQSELAALNEWRKHHGVTVIFDDLNGIATFGIGVEWAPLIHSDYVVVIYP